ncbi:hypothetical protein, conserved [Leishmania tarentolae]|uniref:Uncharacterized protein n=1 Tax=Leishmania tarentolae TaxID=5689 RepID=A0A640KWZ2_LEITA|nr:hypothetical protein, conserved [Leishmania tarentolae]
MRAAKTTVLVALLLGRLSYAGGRIPFLVILYLRRTVCCQRSARVRLPPHDNRVQHYIVRHANECLLVVSEVDIACVPVYYSARNHIRTCTNRDLVARAQRSLAGKRNARDKVRSKVLTCKADRRTGDSSSSDQGRCVDAERAQHREHSHALHSQGSHVAGDVALPRVLHACALVKRREKPLHPLLLSVVLYRSGAALPFKGVRCAHRQGPTAHQSPRKAGGGGRYEGGECLGKVACGR